MSMMIKHCETCALADPRSLVCQLSGMTIDPAADFCSKHTTEAELGTCAICNHKFLGKGLLMQREDQSWIEVCHDCYGKLNTCAMCQHGRECRLQNDTSVKIPLTVMKEVRKGPAIIRQQVINPDRIDATCKAGCDCWDGEGCCKTDFNICAKYIETNI